MRHSWGRIILVAISLLIPAGLTLEAHRETGSSRMILFTVICALTVTAVTRVVQALHSADRSERRLAFDATHDSLTGLPNRRMMLDYLSHTLAAPLHASGLAVLFLDLDRFKLVNDSLGHSLGDDLLIKVAERLRAHVDSTTSSPGSAATSS